MGNKEHLSEEGYEDWHPSAEQEQRWQAIHERRKAMYGDLLSAVTANGALHWDAHLREEQRKNNYKHKTKKV